MDWSAPLETVMKDIQAQYQERLAAAPLDWQQAAQRLGEELASTGPDGYYRMTPQEWLDWALARVRELREIEWMLEGLRK